MFTMFMLRSVHVAHSNQRFAWTIGFGVGRPNNKLGNDKGSEKSEVQKRPRIGDERWCAVRLGESDFRS